MKASVYKNKRSLLDEVVTEQDRVLDVGFWGQAVSSSDSNWPHRILKENAREVWGVDIDFDETQVSPPERYHKADASSFSFDTTFDLIFAGDLIEHLSNPGLFLDACRRHSMPETRLVLTTPNAFNTFTMASKLWRREPPVNPDHTFYFNSVVLSKLLEKNGWRVERVAYIDTFPAQMNVKRWVVWFLHRFLRFLTPTFCETLVVVAVPTSRS